MMSDDARSRRRDLELPRSASTRRPRTRWGRVRRLLGPEFLERRDLPAQFSLGSLFLDGSFAQSGSVYTATGPVEIGYAPTSTESFYPLTVWNGDLSFSTGGSSFSFSGAVQGIEALTDVTIAQVASSQTFSVASLTSTGVGISGSPLGVMGASFTANGIALLDPAGGDTTDAYVSLQGGLGFAQLAGLSVPVSGSISWRSVPRPSAWADAGGGRHGHGVPGLRREFQPRRIVRRLLDR